MPEEKIVLLVPGTASQKVVDPNLRQFLNIQTFSSHDIIVPRRGEAQPESRVEAPPDSIVKLEYESGLIEYLRLDQFQAELGVSRSAGPVRVPSVLDRGAVPGRSLGEWTLKAMHVFGVSPADALAEESAEAVVRHFDGKLVTGLFRIAADGTFK